MAFKKKKFLENTKEMVKIIVQVVQLTALHFKNQYFESDHYRTRRLHDLLNGVEDEEEKKFDFADLVTVLHGRKKKVEEESQEKIKSMVLSDGTKKPSKSGDKSPKGSNGGKGQKRSGGVKKKDALFKQGAKWYSEDHASKLEEKLRQSLSKEEQSNLRNYQEQIYTFFNSPFRNDKIFALKYLNSLSRDLKDDQAEDTINRVFFDKFFNIILTSDDNLLVDIAFDTVMNLVDSEN